MSFLLKILGVPIKQPIPKNEKHSSEKKSFFMPNVFRMALDGMKSEEALEKYLEKQAKLHPEEYQQAIQDYFKEKLAQRTGLMRHVSFFDRDNTSKLNFWDVEQGFIDLGFGTISAYLNTILVIGGGILGTRKKELSVEDSHQLTHPKSHTALFNQNRTNFNNEAHENRLNKMVKHFMNGREQLEEKDIEDIVQNLGKNRSKNCLDEVARTLLRPLQRVAFTNILNLNGGSLTEKDLIEFFTGTFFYARAEPASVAHRIITMR